MWVLVKKETPSSLYLPFKYCNTLIGFLLSLLFLQRKKNPDSFSLPLHSCLLSIISSFDHLHASFLTFGAQNGAQSCRWSLTSTEYSGMIMSLPLLVMECNPVSDLHQIHIIPCCCRVLLNHVGWMSIGSPHPFQQGSSPPTQVSMCTGCFGCSVPGAGLDTCLC